MSFKSKFLNIVTFGYVKRKAKKEAKKQAENKNTELKVNTIELPNIELFVETLGGRDNILEMSNTISTLTIHIDDFAKTNIDDLKRLTGRGVIKSSNNITVMIGDCAELLKEKIIEYKNK